MTLEIRFSPLPQDLILLLYLFLFFYPLQLTCLTHFPGPMLLPVFPVVCGDWISASLAWCQLKIGERCPEISWTSKFTTLSLEDCECLRGCLRHSIYNFALSFLPTAQNPKVGHSGPLRYVLCMHSAQLCLLDLPQCQRFTMPPFGYIFSKVFLLNFWLDLCL